MSSALPRSRLDPVGVEADVSDVTAALHAAVGGLIMVDSHSAEARNQGLPAQGLHHPGTC